MHSFFVILTLLNKCLCKTTSKYQGQLITQKKVFSHSSHVTLPNAPYTCTNILLFKTGAIIAIMSGYAFDFLCVLCCSCHSQKRGWTVWITAFVSGRAAWRGWPTGRSRPGQMAARTAHAWCVERPLCMELPAGPLCLCYRWRLHPWGR